MSGRLASTIPESLGISGQKWRLLNALMSAPVCTTADLHASLYPCAAKAPGPELITVWVYALRKQLKAHGLDGIISAQRGYGYFIAPEDRARLLAHAISAGRSEAALRGVDKALARKQGGAEAMPGRTPPRPKPRKQKPVPGLNDLSPSLSRLLDVLMSGRAYTPQGLVSLLHGPRSAADPKNVSMCVSRLRKRLAGHGIEGVVLYGACGYYITAEGCARIASVRAGKGDPLPGSNTTRPRFKPRDVDRWRSHQHRSLPVGREAASSRARADQDPGSSPGMRGGASLQHGSSPEGRESASSRGSAEGKCQRWIVEAGRARQCGAEANGTYCADHRGSDAPLVSAYFNRMGGAA